MGVTRSGSILKKRKDKKEMGKIAISKDMKRTKTNCKKVHWKGYDMVVKFNPRGDLNNFEKRVRLRKRKYTKMHFC